MNISSVSSDLSSYLIDSASQMKSDQLGLQFQTAVLKEMMDQQKMQANALLEMINRTPSPEGTGSLVDVSA